MGEFVKIDLGFPKWIETLKNHENEIYLLMAATIQTNRALMFDTSNAGRTPWSKPLLREGQPLSQKGALRQSFGPRNDGVRPKLNPGSVVRYGNDVVTVGTNVKYAAILNTGGIIRPKRFPVLWIPLPDGAKGTSNQPSDVTKKMKEGGSGAPIVVGRNGKVYLLAKKAVIPKRPMDEWTGEDQKEMEITLSNKIAEILNHAPT